MEDVVPDYGDAIGEMPPEPDGLPTAEQITQTEIETWEGSELWVHAVVQRNRALGVEAWRMMTGDPGADIPPEHDVIQWRTPAEISAPRTPENIAAARLRVEEAHRRLGI